MEELRADAAFREELKNELKAEAEAVRPFLLVGWNASLTNEQEWRELYVAPIVAELNRRIEERTAAIQQIEQVCSSCLCYYYRNNVHV